MVLSQIFGGTWKSNLLYYSGGNLILKWMGGPCHLDVLVLSYHFGGTSCLIIGSMNAKKVKSKEVYVNNVWFYEQATCKQMSFSMFLLGCRYFILYAFSLAGFWSLFVFIYVWVRTEGWGPGMMNEISRFLQLARGCKVLSSPVDHFHILFLQKGAQSFCAVSDFCSKKSTKKST